MPTPPVAEKFDCYKQITRVNEIGNCTLLIADSYRKIGFDRTTAVETPAVS